MQAQTIGRPSSPSSSLKQRRPGFARPNVEVTLGVLDAIDREADAHDRGRAAEIRVLLGEALAARGAKVEEPAKHAVSKKVKGAQKKK